MNAGLQCGALRYVNTRELAIDKHMYSETFNVIGFSEIYSSSIELLLENRDI